MENISKNLSKNILDKLDPLKCPICLDIVENVRELPCRHIFCFKCLEIYKKEKNALICPICKRETSKRTFLSRDAALDSLCSFVKTLCEDVQVNHEIDIKTFFTNKYNEMALRNKLKTTSESDEVIPQLSDDNIIPCTSKPKDVKKSLKKRNLNNSKLSIKTAPKPVELNITKNTAIEEQKKKAIPKIGLSRKQNKIKVNPKDNSVQLKPIVPQLKQNSGRTCSNKHKILQWLHDTRNRFERFSQTQSYSTQNNTPEDVDMLSVSQIYIQKKKDVKSDRVKEKQLKSEIDKGIRDKRAQSVENLTHYKCKQLRRHSLDCTSPIETKQFENFQEKNCIENQLIMNLIEDEVLNVIDKEISGENSRKKMPLESNTKESVKNLEVMNVEEDKFLDQLDNEMMESSGEAKKKTTCNRKNMDSTEIENKSRSSWKNIKKFKKTVGKTKVPKKLDISLQSTQKYNKKEVDTKLNASDPFESTKPTVMENKIVDFQELEEYFSKAIPKIMETNIGETSSQEIISDEEMYHKDSKANPEQEKDNNSDIYIYQTQPLSTKKIDPKIDKISYASKLTKKLETILLQLTKEDKIKPEELTSLLPPIESIFKIFNCINTPQKLVEKGNQSFSDKEIQTDLLSLDVFPITPNAAFKTLVSEDVATQTDKHWHDCPHSCPRKTFKNMADIATSPIMFSNKIIGNVEETSGSEQRALNKSNIEFAQEDSVPKLHIHSSKVEEEENINLPLLKEQTSSNANMTKNMNTSLLDSQILVDQILEQCNTQYLVSLKAKNKISNSPNITNPVENTSKMNESKLTSKASFILDTSQGSAIMCSVPQSNSRVNRKLMFEKAIQERNELKQTLKRVRTNSTSDSDEDRPYKIKCNRFLQNDLSIEFESEILEDKSQYLKNSEVVMAVPNGEGFPGVTNELTQCRTTKNENTNNRTQADTLLNYCDELIEKANRHISVENTLSDHGDDIIMSQILSENNKNIRNNERPNQSFIKVHEANEKMKSQDLLKHYDELIERASRQIDIEDVAADEHHNKKMKHNNSQIATTSKNVHDSEEVREERNVLKTQDLLDHCNALIAKTTREIARNEIRTSQNENVKAKIQSQNDDEFFCQNLDRLDSVLEKENNRVEITKEKLSESLFETWKENLIHENSVAENLSVVEVENIHSTPKRRKSVEKDEKKGNIMNSTSKMKKGDGFNSSDDEIFSDVDVVETTPQKSISFLERLSCSQAVNQNARTSLRIEENGEDFPASMNIVPPPPGFNDIDEKAYSEQLISSSERESENVIPTSLSPRRFEVPLMRKPLAPANMNQKKFSVPAEVTTLSQQFMKVSPICREKSKNLNVIEMVRQSKFSPLTILPKSKTPVLTSTPKQKSILSYVKPRLKSSQEASTSTSERTKPCIAFTRLNNPETLCVLALCKKNLATRQDKFGPDVTHMIVSVDKNEYVKDHTIKFISAIAAGIWVLNIKWVQECLSKNHIVDEEPFEVLDITGIPSPRISRLTRLTNPLFKGFKFFIPRSFTQTSDEDVKNIIQLLQGVLVSSIEELKDEKEYICIIISELADTEDYTQYENWLHSYKIITVDINWLSLSVSRYKVLSLRPHLLCSDDSIDELGYPSHLVVDVASSLTQDVTYG